jgi:putative hydrolase of the HAD superfamily
MGRFDDPALHAIFDKLQRGVVGESQFYDELRAYAGNSALSDQELEQAWKSQIGAVSCEKVALMRRVREMGYKTFILSTTNAPHLEVIQDRFASCLPEARDPLRESVDAAFLTFEMQMLKPDVEIYLAVIERTGLRGDQLLFLDDTPKNVLGAQHAGLHSLLIDGPGFLHWLPALLQ